MKISKIFDNFDLIQSFCHLNKDRMLNVLYALVTLMARYTQQMTLWSKIIQSHHLLQLQFANTSQIYEYCSRRLFASLLSVVVCLHSNSIGSFIYLLAHEHMHSCAHTHTHTHTCAMHTSLHTMKICDLNCLSMPKYNIDSSRCIYWQKGARPLVQPNNANNWESFEWTKYHNINVCNLISVKIQVDANSKILSDSYGNIHFALLTIHNIEIHFWPIFSRKSIPIILFFNIQTR